VALVGSQFSAWPSREVLGMDLQQGPGDVSTSRSGAQVVVDLCHTRFIKNINRAIIYAPGSSHAYI
jgi:hypothetical protein